MLQNNTVSKLHEMKLGVMASSFQKQLDDSAASELCFEDRFSMLVDAGWTSRKNNRLKRLMRKADYSLPGACIEDICSEARVLRVQSRYLNTSYIGSSQSKVALINQLDMYARF